MNNKLAITGYQLFIVFFSFLTFYSPLISAQNINTVAGNGYGYLTNTGGYSGDGGAATDAEIWDPSGVFVDNSGNLFFADQSNNRIRMVNTSGVISTFAGNGVGAYTGDGGQATLAEINAPQGIFIDRYGNLFIGDFFNNVIRKVATTGIITTVAGNGVSGNSGDGGLATSAELNGPSDVCVDSIGRIFIADETYSHIRVVTTTGIIRNFAGNGTAGFSGDGGPATSAEIHGPSGVRIDAAQNIYIADLQNSVIRKVSTSDTITTVAGIGLTYGFSGDGGQATSAELARPTGLCIDPFGNMYIDDNYRIRMVNSSGVISSVAGNGNTGGYSGDGGPATNAEINYPFAVAADAQGNIYIDDVFNNRVREVAFVTTGVTNEIPLNKGVTIYPNPNNGVFNLVFSHSELARPELGSRVSESQSIIRIYNVLGEKVFSATLKPLNQVQGGQVQGDYTIDLSNQPKGIYLYKVLSETGLLIGNGKIVTQ